MDFINLANAAELLNSITSLLPEKISENFEVDGYKGSLEKDGDTIKLVLKSVKEDFDDSVTKQLVEEYKDNIKDLDDDLFLEIVEELKSKLDINKFNELLELDNYTAEQAEEVENMLDISSDVIGSHLQHKIREMVKLYSQF